MILSGPLKPGTEEVGRPRGRGLQRRGRSVRTSPVPLGSGPDAPALAPLAPRSLVTAAARLSIQEEQGASGRPGGNYNSQEALRRRGAHRGPVKAKERARAEGPLAGGGGRGSRRRALCRLVGVAREGLRRARSRFIGWGRGGGAPEGAHLGGGHGGNRRRLPESERGPAGGAGWGRGARPPGRGARAGPAGTLRPGPLSDPRADPEPAPALPSGAL